MWLTTCVLCLVYWIAVLFFGLVLWWMIVLRFKVDQVKVANKSLKLSQKFAERISYFFIINSGKVAIFINDLVKRKKKKRSRKRLL